MSKKIKVEIVEKIFEANNQLAKTNRDILDSAGCYGLNIMASPGAGKTSVILHTIQQLKPAMKIGVIEGDTAPVTIDADKIVETGCPAIQINTGGDCHLDASMLNAGFQKMPISTLDVLIVENVGNLICPAAFSLGTHANVMISSVPEGDDKPYKYPNIYRNLDVLILNKIDLLPYVDFSLNTFMDGLKLLNPGLIVFQLSCKTSVGVPEWGQWLSAQIRKHFPEKWN